MNIGKKGIELIKEFEGLYLNAYLCQAGVATIGWGTTVYPNGTKVRLGDKITLAQAKEYFSNDMKKHENHVMLSVVYPLLKAQEQFDALVSFVYNVGEGGVLYPNSIDERIKNGEDLDTVISEELPRWNKADGKVSAGLVRRRQAELDLFFSVETPSESLFIELNEVSTNVLKLQKSLNQWLDKWKKPLLKCDSCFGNISLSAVNDFCKNNNLEQNEKGVIKKVFEKITNLYDDGEEPVKEEIKVFQRGVNEQLSKNFHLSEFTCKCGRCRNQLIGMKMISLLQQVRDKMGVPLYITSAYRCPTHNTNVGGVSNSRHTCGDAIDISISNLNWRELVKVAKEVGFTGIGYGQDRGFIHLDTWTTREWDY